MAVQPDRGARPALQPGALERLAEAGLAAARGAAAAEVVHAIAAAGRAAGTDAVVVRVADDEGHLLVRAAVATSAGLAAELEGLRVDAAGWPLDECRLEDAPEPVQAIAERLGADGALAIPVLVGDELRGSLELYSEVGDVHPDAAAVGRLAASQLALVLASGVAARRRAAEAVGATLRLAGDALAAGGDAANAELHVLRLALELSGADGAALWRYGGDGSPFLVGAVGADTGMPPDGPSVERVEGRWVVSEQLGDGALGVLQVVFSGDEKPPAELRDRLREFAQRTAHALRAAEQTRLVADELDHTRALLAVVGQATAQLSLSHALDTAVDRVAELLGVDRLAIYLLDDGRLTTAASRGLAGPHLPAAEAFFELALGPFRGRGIVALPDVAAEPRLAGVADALAEAGIDAATAVPLSAGGAVTGLLLVVPERGRTQTQNEGALLVALADRLAVTVENARLHEQATLLGAELEEALASERAAARRLRAHYEISRSFAQTLSMELTLETVARTVVELLEVDVAVLRMPDPRREQLLPVAMAVADPRLAEPVRTLLYRPQPLTGAGILRLFRSGEPLVLDVETTTELGGTQALLSPFLAKGSTAAVVPIATPAEVLASLTLLSIGPERPIDAEAIETAVAIGGQAALAIDNARLYQQQKDFADAMQRSLLPQVRPDVAGLDVGEVYASSAHVEVGGDLYDYVALPDGRLAIVLGDVMGHGVDAAADMAMAKYVFRSLAREHADPGAFLAAANEIVAGEIAAGKFITMLYLLIDAATGEVACASAGHPPPRMIRSEGSVHGIEVSGLALGIDASVTYEPAEVHLEHGDVLVLYTDGVIEARRGRELYGIERLDAALVRRRARSAEDIAMVAVESARRFTGGELLDDCAVVVVKRTS